MNENNKKIAVRIVVGIVIIFLLNWAYNKLTEEKDEGPKKKTRDELGSASSGCNAIGSDEFYKQREAKYEWIWWNWNSAFSSQQRQEIQNEFYESGDADLNQMWHRYAHDQMLLEGNCEY